MFGSPNAFFTYCIAVDRVMSYDCAKNYLEFALNFGMVKRQDLEIRRLHEGVFKIWDKLATGIEIHSVHATHIVTILKIPQALSKHKCNLSRNDTLSF